MSDDNNSKKKNKGDGFGTVEPRYRAELIEKKLSFEMGNKEKKRDLKK